MGTTEQRTSEIACKELQLPITPQEFHVQMKELGNRMLRDAPLMKGIGVLNFVNEIIFNFRNDSSCYLRFKATYRTLLSE